jgi:flagellar hook-associated protein 1 FlgK
MAGNLLNIGKTGLFAAQAGLSTTGHNIANANVAGYSRQRAVQSTSVMQDFGYGFVGTGTKVADIQRYTDEFLNVQVRSAQSASSALDAYASQINQVDNLLADPTSGLSPALQDFFKAVQNVSSNPAEISSRQALLSNSEALAARFQGMNGRLQEMRQGVNAEVTSNVTLINSYAQQIARLNDQIGAMASGTGALPNDLLDSRDQLIIELNKQIKATVAPGENNSLSVSIGNGQPLVMGNRTYQLAVTESATDPSRLQVGYVSNGKVTELAENIFKGGELGGLMDFRTNTLDPAINALGRVAIGLAATVNAQHRLGQDAASQMGGDLFTMAGPAISANKLNLYDASMPVSAVISDVTKLTASDYKVTFDGTNYSVARLPDGQPQMTASAAYPQTLSKDGIDFRFSVAAYAGDSFLVRPTANGAALMSVNIKDPAKVAAAAPIMTEAPLLNKGTGKISEGTVDKDFLATPNAVSGGKVTLTYDSAAGALSGFPAGLAVTMTDAAGLKSFHAAGAAVPFSAGASYSFGGASVTISGQPVNNDTFVINDNDGVARDNRNMRLIGELQAKRIFDGNNASYQSAYAQLVGTIGNKAREVQVNAEATSALLVQASASQQNVAGVNLDEEAANLLKYQQAYQAAGKVMQIAGTLFDTLLSIGH